MMKMNPNNNTIMPPTVSNYKRMFETKYKLNELKEFAKMYHLKVSGPKKMLQQRIYNYLHESSYVVRIQTIFRGYLIRKYIKVHGPALMKRSLCTNTTDFISMEPIEEIPFHQFISYKDVDEFVYGFDITSLHNLLLKSNGVIKNPYNRTTIPEFVLKNMRTIIRVSRILRIKINLNIEDALKQVSNETAIELRAITLFQHINELGNYSNAQWFLSLNRFQIYRFIEELVDIWNYRAQLSRNIKREICPPFGNPFMSLDIDRLIGEPNLWDIKNELLSYMESLVNSGVNVDSKSLGAYYVLGALTIVSNDAASSLPWLFQSFL